MMDQLQTLPLPKTKLGGFHKLATLANLRFQHNSTHRSVHYATYTYIREVLNQ